MSSDALRHTLGELVDVARNDQLRGGVAPGLLDLRYRSVSDAAAAREPFAYREALLELAACATALAARLQAPAAAVPRLTRDAPPHQRPAECRRPRPATHAPRKLPASASTHPGISAKRGT